MAMSPFATAILSTWAALAATTDAAVRQNTPVEESPCSFHGESYNARAPVIVAPPVRVPELRLRLVDAQSGRDQRPARVYVRYIWEWLEYPYPEHPRGAWSGADEEVRCEPEGASLIVPARTVQPRGWYEGRFARTPRFDRLELLIQLPTCTLPDITIRHTDLPRFEGAQVTAKVACGKVVQLDLRRPSQK
jgi:hypothetical protein